MGLVSLLPMGRCDEHLVEKAAYKPIMEAIILASSCHTSGFLASGGSPSICCSTCAGCVWSDEVCGSS